MRGFVWPGLDLSKINWEQVPKVFAIIDKMRGRKRSGVFFKMRCTFLFDLVSAENRTARQFKIFQNDRRFAEFVPGRRVYLLYYGHEFMGNSRFR